MNMENKSGANGTDTIKLTLSGWYATEYNYGYETGSPLAFEMSAITETRQIAESWRDRFPKSCKIHATGLSTRDEGVKGIMSVHIKLGADKVNSGVNETGLKRYRAIVKAAAKMGIEIEYVANSGNAYPTRQAFEEAIGA